MEIKDSHKKERGDARTKMMEKRKCVKERERKKERKRKRYS